MLTPNVSSSINRFHKISSLPFYGLDSIHWMSASTITFVKLFRQAKKTKEIVVEELSFHFIDSEMNKQHTIKSQSAYINCTAKKKIVFSTSMQTKKLEH